MIFEGYLYREFGGGLSDFIQIEAESREAALDLARRIVGPSTGWTEREINTSSWIKAAPPFGWDRRRRDDPFEQDD